jgi:hypothetical protein
MYQYSIKLEDGTTKKVRAISVTDDVTFGFKEFLNESNEVILTIQQSYIVYIEREGEDNGNSN